MKVLFNLILICSIPLLSGCPLPRTNEPPLTKYRPLLMQRSELNQSIMMQAPRAMNNPGKIFYKDGYILITERYQGIHFIDNSNPAIPVKVGFLRIPGCNDIAIKGQILYADNATDLLSINFSNPQAPAVINRKENVFPEPLPPDLGRIPAQYAKENRPGNMVLVGWITNQ
ncbi:MAG: hypothetical protein K1X81_07890 [Bacteroidia bacterium]|nr:hypothetical protein [Bacteroidia bacterium]